MAEFIVETSYLSRRIIRQTDNSSKYKSEDEFWRIICLDIIYLSQETDCENTETIPLMWKVRQNTVYIPSRYKFRDW